MAVPHQHTYRGPTPLGSRLEEARKQSEGGPLRNKGSLTSCGKGMRPVGGDSGCGQLAHSIRWIQSSLQYLRTPGSPSPDQRMTGQTAGPHSQTEGIG